MEVSVAEAKILIADDESFIRLLIEQALEELEDEGVALLTAGDGLEALETIERERPDLVFLDVMMPHMNGFEVCRVVKRELNIEDVYVVMLTAKGQEIDKQRGEEVGADLYITKPFDPDELLSLSEKVLGLA
jgi:two-component system alkaline phosphatase synthesis response regulator PhoP